MTDLNSSIYSKPIYDYTLKFIIVGDSTVGKSNIMSRFIDNRFDDSHDMTIGIEFSTKIVALINTDSSNNLESESNLDFDHKSSINYKIQIWDTAGQETFKAITRSYYRGTIGCIVVYDTTNRESFESVSEWVSELKKHCDPQIVVALIGNKIDLDKRQVTYDEGKELADKHGFIFFETSAKKAINVKECFFEIVKQINKKIETKEIDVNSSKGCIRSNIDINVGQKESTSWWSSFC